MGQCQYCGDSAGIFRSAHKECKDLHYTGGTKFRDSVRDAVEHQDMARLKADMQSIAQSHYIGKSSARLLTIRGWEHAVIDVLSDHLLTENEESGLATIADEFGLAQSELDENGAFTRLKKSAIIRDLADGELPSGINVVGDMPFRFQKTEKLLFVFDRTKYYEDKTRKEFVGRSKGVSVRVAKGVYFRAGASKGRSVEVTETISHGEGVMAVTNRHIYYLGDNSKSMRIRHDKVITIEPFEDGVELQRDAASAKPQKFITGDGWFTYNLLQNATNI